MRLPFLQVEADLLGQRGQVAAKLLGVPLPALIGHVTLLRAYALSLSGDEVPSGWVHDAEAVQVLEIAAGWDGDPGKLVRVLAMPAVYMLEMDPAGAVRVLGMEPYAKAHEANAKARERVAKSEARKREAAANLREASRKEREVTRKLPRKTETETETEMKKEDLPLPPQGGPPSPAQANLLEQPPKRPADAPDALMAAWNQHAPQELPRCRELTDKRRKHARVRLSERPVAQWVDIIQRMGRSRFLRGLSSGRTWVATFDWLISSPDPGAKVLEGQYDDKGSAMARNGTTYEEGSVSLS